MTTKFQKKSSARQLLDNQTDQVKVPPHSIEAEQAVLGGLMLDNKAWDRILECVSEIDFYRSDHRLIFQVITELARRNKPFDMLTLTDALKAINGLETAGGEAFLYQLANNTPSAANIVAYAEIVRERSVLRQLLSAANDIADLAFHTEGRPSKELLDEAERRIFRIGDQTARNTQGPLGISELLAKATDRIDTLFHTGNAVTGLATGFVDFDEMTAGLQEGELIIIAGRPSMGKTALAMNIAEHAAISNDKPVVIFSMEMPGEMLAMRMMSSLGRINQHKVRTGKLSKEDWPRIASAVSMLSEASMFIDDSPALSPGELRGRARRIARSHGPLGLIVIDYLQLMQVPGSKENRTTEITEISRSLKALAKEMHVPVIALSQLNRGLEQRDNKRPVMSDIRESGAIEQDADLIAFIYRDEVYNEGSNEKGVAEIIIGKQRNGPIGKVKLTFLGEYTRFENYARL